MLSIQPVARIPLRTLRPAISARTMLPLKITGRSIMEFSSDGGVFALDITEGEGVLTVRIPWEVAIDGLKAERRIAEPEEDDLKQWLAANEDRFSAMVASRIDRTRAATEPDDPRVIAEESRAPAQGI